MTFSYKKNETHEKDDSFHDIADLDFDFITFEIWSKVIKDIFDNRKCLKKQSLQFDILYSPFNNNCSDLVESLKEEQKFIYIIANKNFLHQSNLFSQFTIKSFSIDHSYKQVELIHPVIFILTNSIYYYLIEKIKSHFFNQKKITTFFPFNFNENKINFSEEDEWKKFKKAINDTKKKYKYFFSINIRNFFSSISDSLLTESFIDVLNLNNNSLITIKTFIKFLNLKSNSIIPLFETSPLFFFISSFIVLKRILILFIEKHINNFNFEIIHYVDNVWFFCDEENNLNDLYIILKNFLLNNFNLEINYLKTQKFNLTNKNQNILDEKKDLSFNYYFERLLNFAENLENNFFDDYTLINTFEQKEKIKLSDHLSTSNITEEEYLNLLKKINLFSENKSSLNFIKLISLNSKFFIKFLSELDEKYSNGKDDYLIKKIYDFLEGCNNNYDKISIIEKLYFNEIIYYYFLNRSFRKLKDWKKDDFFKFYENSKSFNLFFENCQDEFKINKIKKYNSNFGWAIYSLSKKDYITATLSISSTLEDTCTFLLKTKEIEFIEKEKWKHFNDEIKNSFSPNYANQIIKTLRNVKTFRNTLQFVHYSENKKNWINNTNEIEHSLKASLNYLISILEHIIN